MEPVQWWGRGWGLVQRWGRGPGTGTEAGKGLGTSTEMGDELGTSAETGEGARDQKGGCLKLAILILFLSSGY